jgi:single-strand DNA-binding protein
MINRVIMVGRLTRDPEVHDTASGGKLANMRLVTTEYRKGEDGQRRDEVQYHSVVAIGRLGEICAEYLTKGRLVYIEGKLQTREWEGKDGMHRYTTEVLAETMQMLSPRPAGDGQGMSEEETAGVMAGAGAA